MSSFSYVVVDPILTYPAPAGIKADFRVKQGAVWNPPPSDPFQYGSGFLVAGWWPGVQQDGLRYFGIPGVRTWYNVTGGVLDYFDRTVPYP